MMKKLTVVVNDYGSNTKLFISYETTDIDKLEAMWMKADARLLDLQVLEPFQGYTTWSELTPQHYRFLISRGLNILSEMSAINRADTKDENVQMTNFLILAFIRRIEDLTGSEVEQFRINRFDSHNVTYDYSASFELQYDCPRPKAALTKPETATKPASNFAIVVDNSDEPRED